MSAEPWLLMYHSVSDDRRDPYQITVTPDRLRAQLRWLRRRGLRGVGVAELLRAGERGEDSGLVGLTFDDGYADFLHQALPLLEAERFGATLFVLPGLLGEHNHWDPLGPRKPLLTAEEVRRVRDGGVEIGCHGLTHRRLPGLDAAVLRREVTEAKGELEEVTGSVVEGFCYPYGAVDRPTVTEVAEAGYSYGCAIRPGDLTGPHALARTHVGQRDTGVRLGAKWARHTAEWRVRAGRAQVVGRR